jgi:hypothetical protein
VLDRRIDKRPGDVDVFPSDDLITEFAQFPQVLLLRQYDRPR